MSKKETKPEVKNTEVKNEGVVDELRSGNMMSDTAVTAALAEIEKEKDEKKKKEAKEAICIATYHNRRTLIELRARRREDDITKSKLESTKDLLERMLGVRTEIKDGQLVPTKETIKKEDKLTPTEYREAKNKLTEDIRKKMHESDALMQKELTELRESYEGRYRYYWD